ncbi:4-phosphoerythronate dehydrogenase [Thalassotalea atypica]|uniref:4-phosphoerythronate dehydrogenase n=1 Tax=Thalassotalea atypica TaxID=2054316 RepID=UPI0025736450|nr:4-phosphoerythronate dehydrogenase [Thalassotalea atypica]
MKILFDENMPFAAEFFSGIAGKDTTLHPFDGRKLTAEETQNADVLLVRSITQVNQSLLHLNKRLQFVGTATIGVDHIDQNYLAARNIPFHSSPGCNAVSVAEYVLSALIILAERYQFALNDKTVGIVGAGNTGSRLSEKLTALGIKHLLYDPLLESNDDTRVFSSLSEVLACDIISLHVPLTTDGEYPTFHLLDQVRIKELNTDQILINACRGEVVDNQALLSQKNVGLGPKLVLDVWEREPNILTPLIEHTEIASAHIAGYSLEGKARGTEMLYRALCHQLDIPCEFNLSQFLPSAVISEVEINQHFDENLLNALTKMVYDVRRDDAIFRQQINEHGFDHIRKTYPARREFSSVIVSCSKGANSNGCYGVGFSQPQR